SGARYVVGFQNTKIQIFVSRYPEYQYGDKLKIKGVLKEPNNYYFHQGILGVIYNPEVIEKNGQSGNILTKKTYQIRDKFEESLNRSLSEPYASFAAGLVLGSKRNMPDSLMSDFNRTGTTHIVAVSGYNVTIMIIYIGLLLGILSQKLKFWGSLIVILGFVVMTGASASVVRAGLLAGLVALGQFEGRRINMLILLLLVASLILLFNPYALKFDISFQLSFLAFAGLVYLSGPISNLKIIKWLPKFWKLTLAETLGAQIAVLPILIYYFGRVSVVSPIVNILILWLIPLSMLAVFAIGIGGLVWGILGQVVGYIGWFLLKYIIVVVESFSKISWASLEIKTTSWWWMTIFYCLIAFWIYESKRENQNEPLKT
ncbi:MAG: ComEC/Rec2-related protein, partial [Berkelbacteria bacterium GW2011_GWA1_36_9]